MFLIQLQTILSSLKIKGSSQIEFIFSTSCNFVYVEIRNPEDITFQITLLSKFRKQRQIVEEILEKKKVETGNFY